ncbi:AraC family transcriptional regulator ligand-binding domain-containing protein [Methylobacterium trifolii]
MTEEVALVLARLGGGQTVTTAPPPPGGARASADADTASFAHIAWVMADCAVRTNCPHFGLLVGQGDFVASLGLAGFLIPGSQTVGAALGNFIGHLRSHAGEAAPTLVVAGSRAHLGFPVSGPSVEAREQVADVALAMALNVMRILCGADWDPVEATLPRPRPADQSPFTRFYRAPVSFGAAGAALVFPADVLGRPIVGGELLRALFAFHLEPRTSPTGASFGDDVRRVLRTRLLGQECSAETVAGLFSMHRRTLNRHLNGEGLAFNAMVNEVRFEIARRLMANGGMNFGQIAAALSFSETSAFTRAFRRWSGQTPTAWRAGHRRT